MKILYIDDNRLLISYVKRMLETTYTVDVAHTGDEGVQKAHWVDYGVILLDLGLPDKSGLEVCRELRKLNIHTPIIILTVQKDSATIAELLNCGADDFLAKPFNGNVLKARINAILRRSPQMTEERVVTVGDLTVNLTRRQVKRQDTPITLRRKEFDILEYLVTNQGRALTRDMIIDHVWESGKESWNNTVDVHIKHLRDKVDRPFGSQLIKTAFGIGYMVDDAS